MMSLRYISSVSYSILLDQVFFFDKIKMISSNYSHSDTDNSLSTFTSSLRDTDDEIDLTKWTATLTVSRDPFRFVGSREVQVKGAEIPITLTLTQGGESRSRSHEEPKFHSISLRSLARRLKQSQVTSVSTRIQIKFIRIHGDLCGAEDLSPPCPHTLTHTLIYEFAKESLLDSFEKIT